MSDTGPGIAPQIAAQLFQPFVTTKRQGMGVGLSISRTIIEAHGGELGLQPNPGGGAMFRFTLPSADGERMRRWRLTAVVHVVDDDDAMRESLAFLLETAGLDVRDLRIAARLSWPAPARGRRPAWSPTSACRR